MNHRLANGPANRSAKKALIPVLLLAVATVVAQAQSPVGEAEQQQEARSDDQAFQGQVSVGYVLVPVVVRTRDGFAERLGPADFRLRVDGRVAPIESFESGANAPIGILFLQDLSGSMGVAPKLRRSRRLIQCVLDQRNAGDEFAVASFSDEQLFVDVPFPGSPQAIAEAATAWRGYGRTALHDAVAWLPDIVHARASPRRAVVLVTDGVDNASELGPTAAREEIRQAEVPVHVVGLETGSFETLHPEGGKMYELADMLNLIGWATGGGYHPVSGAQDVGTACKAIVEDLRHQYVLGFSTQGDGTPSRHRIEVELTGKSKKLRLDHRRSYEGTLPHRISASR